MSFDGVIFNLSEIYPSDIYLTVWKKKITFFIHTVEGDRPQKRDTTSLYVKEELFLLWLRGECSHFYSRPLFSPVVSLNASSWPVVQPVVLWWWPALLEGLHLILMKCYSACTSLQASSSKPADVIPSTKRPSPSHLLLDGWAPLPAWVVLGLRERLSSKKLYKVPLAQTAHPRPARKRKAVDMQVSKARCGCLELFHWVLAPLKAVSSGERSWAGMLDRRLRSPQTKSIICWVSIWAERQVRCVAWFRGNRNVLNC